MKKLNITPRRRAHLERLAAYLEGLPADYTHFDMGNYIAHKGNCSVVKEGMEDKTFVEKGPDVFLNNCGAFACALGHGPSAGIPLSKAHIGKTDVYDWQIGKSVFVADIDWNAYAKHNFFSANSDAWEFCFGGEWEVIDNHHYGAAARIRYLLDKGEVPMDDNDDDYDPYFYVHSGLVDLYKPYRIDAQQVAA